MIIIGIDTGTKTGFINFNGAITELETLGIIQAQQVVMQTYQGTFLIHHAQFTVMSSLFASKTRQRKWVL